jgi:hypothetical protein
MQILLAFAPFIVFAIIDRIAGSLAGLLAGAVVVLLLLGRDWLIKKHSPKILDIGYSRLVFWLVPVFLAGEAGVVGNRCSTLR